MGEKILEELIRRQQHDKTINKPAAHTKCGLVIGKKLLVVCIRVHQ